MTQGVDAFWGLPASSVRVRRGAPQWVRVRMPGGQPEAALAEPATAWIPGLGELGGEPLVTAEGDHGPVTLVARDDDGTVVAGFDPDHAIAELTRRHALTANRPLAARLPFNYRRVPAPIRAALRNLLTRRQAGTVEAYPAWPWEPSVEILRAVWLHARRAAGDVADPEPFWPQGKRFAAALTHDVDSAAGLGRAASFAADERERGLRSCWYVVGRQYPLDESILDDLRAGGAEIGFHDVIHDNRIAFLPPAEIERRLDSVRELVERHEMEGFRSPSMMRTDALYEGLRGRFAYDSSIPDTALLPVRSGCGTVFPLDWSGVPVLPLTLPPDGQLLGRGLEPGQILAAWIEKTERVAAVGGAAVQLTHPDDDFSASAAMREAQRGYLDWLAARDDAWHALPREIIARWRERAAAQGPPAG